MKYSRRELLKLAGGTFFISAFYEAGAEKKEHHYYSQPTRIPLDEFVTDSKRLSHLRAGIAEMKKRKPSDPLSFFFQAAIHGITEGEIKKATKEDSNVPNVVKYWNQCPHNGQSSADFLPWHRGYTFHFENILRMHTGDTDFALPYWNYMSKKHRKFPKEFGIEHLDGNLKNNDPSNINPLYHPKRDYYFTSYEHPFAKGLPLLQLSDSAVDISLPLKSPVFFGATEREGIGGGVEDTDASTRGLLESYPHDQIHRAVGGIIPNGCACACEPPPGEEPDFDAVGAMAQPPTAGFDPIFSIHHCTVDWIWVQWSCMPGKKWGKLPPSAWFNEKPWYFFGTDSKVINEPRKAYFDHRKLGVRFKYENTAVQPLALPEMPELFTEKFVPKKTVKTLDDKNLQLRILPNQKSVIKIEPSSIASIKSTSNFMRTEMATNFKNERIFMRLKDLNTMNTEATGFDLYLTSNTKKALSRGDISFIGSVNLFTHLRPNPEGRESHNMPGMEMDHHLTEEGQSFDVSKALATAENLDDLHLVVIPYSLFDTVDSKALINRFTLRVKGVEFLSVK